MGAVEYGVSVGLQEPAELAEWYKHKVDTVQHFSEYCFALGGETDSTDGACAGLRGQMSIKDLVFP
jgi:hypothetical protein